MKAWKQGGEWKKRVAWFYAVLRAAKEGVRHGPIAGKRLLKQEPI